MNQQSYQPMGGQRPSTVRPWLLIILIIVILAGAGFFWYYYFGPGKSSKATTTTTTTTDKTAGWKTYSNDTYGFSFKYPKDMSIDNKTALDGDSMLFYVPVMASTKGLYKDESDPKIKAMTTVEVLGIKIRTLDNWNVQSAKTDNREKIIAKSDKYAASYDPGPSELFDGPNAKTLLNETIPTMLTTFKFTTPAATTTPTTTSTDLTYTNPTYGFTMTFPAAWKGYKFKEANLSGATATYYVEIPTKDTSATGDTTADAGYYSPFAISVYTLAQWTTVEASSGPKDTLITKGDKYAFAWSQANGVPPSDFTLNSDIQKIIDSFEAK